MTAKRAVVFAVAALIALGMAPVVSTRPGADAVAHAQSFLDYYSGVFALLAFTGAVVWGLIAANRIVPARHRLLAQGIHRMLGMVGFGFLGTHIVLKILAEQAGILDAVIPFLDTRARLVATGLGTIASDLLIVVFAIGTVRGRFAASARPWVWRVLHGISYLAWPIAIMHGLSAGRAAATWVNVSYAVCLVAVLLAVVTRLISPFPAMRAARQRISDEFAGLGGDRDKQRRPAPRPPREPATQPLRQVGADHDAPPGKRPGAPAPRSMPRERVQPRERTRPPERPRSPERPPERPPGRLPDAPREMPWERPREPMQAGAAAAPPVDLTRPAPGAWPGDRTAAGPAQERPEQPSEGWQFWRRQRRRERPLIMPDLEEVEFWAALRAETSVWIRRGRR